MNQPKKLTQIFFVLGLFLILLLATIYLAQNNFELRISALEDDTPTHVVITDITESSFRISWITERKVIGGIDVINGDKVLDRDSTSFHSLNFKGLKPGTKYEFKLLSGTKEFKNPSYSVSTSSTSLTEENFLVYGQVFDPNGVSFQQGGIMTLKLAKDNLKSQKLSTAINEAGGFSFNLGRLQDENLQRSFPYRDKVDALFEVFISSEGGTIEKKYTIDFSENRQIPNIYLGDVELDVIPSIDGTN